MLNKKSKTAIFFILVFLLYVLTCKAHEYMCSPEMSASLPEFLKSSEVQRMVLGALFTLLVVGIFYLANVGSCELENFWDVSLGAKCKGGPYMWQGDDEISKECRALASTKEGQCIIKSYNCPTGYVGTPSLPFVYTPLSGDNFENERCAGKPDCGCPYQEDEVNYPETNGPIDNLSSFTKLVN